MNKTGTNSENENVDNLTAEMLQPEKAVRRRRFLPLLLLAAVLLLAVFVATQVFGVLYGLVFPPDAPLPEGVTELEHDNLAYGADDWLYGTTQDGCAIVAFYEEQGSVCRLSPGMCDTGAFVNPGVSRQNVGTCTGETAFSIFTMRWEVSIGVGYGNTHPTKFRLEREIFWTAPASEIDITPTP